MYIQYRPTGFTHGPLTSNGAWCKKKIIIKINHSILVPWPVKKKSCQVPGSKPMRQRHHHLMLMSVLKAFRCVGVHRRPKYSYCPRHGCEMCAVDPRPEMSFGATTLLGMACLVIRWYKTVQRVFAACTEETFPGVTRQL